MKNKKYKYSIILLFYFTGCLSEKSPLENVEIIELEIFETLVSYDDNILANPTIIKYDNNENLLIYDSQLGELLKLNNRGEVVGSYGSRGRGPGEFIRVSNVFSIEDYIYIIDDISFFIHKYSKDGKYVSSMDYRQSEGLILPPLPPVPAPDLYFLDNMYTANINNLPYIADVDHVLLPTTHIENSVYQMTDFEGNIILDIGEIPAGSTFKVDYDQFRTSILNRELPTLLKSNAYPIKDFSNSSEYFMVYNAIPKIAKYDAEGQKLFSKRITGIPEIDSIKNTFYDTMEVILKWADAVATLRVYTWGVSDSQGNLYLATYTSPSLPLWIHKFNSEAELIQRYKLVSEVNLFPLFDIDINNSRFFVITKESEIRAYQF